MANLRLFNQFNDFEDFFKGFVLKPINFSEDMNLKIKTDVTEDDKSYKIQAELPGVKKEDIKVTIDGNQLTIRAEVKKEKETKDEKSVRSERYYGSVFRSFTLDGDIDEAGADAKYENGVLCLTLPKRPGGKSKQLTVQ